MRVVWIAALATTGCGVRALPPPDPPPREVPRGVELPADPPPREGTSRVLLDADGEPAKVVAIDEGTRPLCTTPCVVDLPYGTHSLVLQSILDEGRRSRADLEVGPRPKIFRHTLGERHEAGPAGTVGTSLVAVGLLAMATGAVVWAGGALARSTDGTPNSLEGTGRLVTGLGAGAVLVGIPLVALFRPTERPGATTEWNVGP